VGPKRTFDESGGTLREVYMQDGQKRVREIDGVITVANKDEPDAFAKVSRLLRALDEGDVAAPHALLPHLVGDARVPAALLKAAADTSGPQLANVAQVLGLAKVDGASEVLKRRLETLREDAQASESTARIDMRSACLASVAVGLLRLTPNALAIDTLVELLDHPVSLARRIAAFAAADALGLPLPPELKQRLEEALRRILQMADDDLFLAVAAPLGTQMLEPMLSRCEKLLEMAEPARRESAVATLLRVSSQRADSMLIEYAERDIDVRTAIMIARQLGPRMPSSLRLVLAERALTHESPSVRLDGIRALEGLRSQEAQRIAARALEDEPDPHLTALLKEL